MLTSQKNLDISLQNPHFYLHLRAFLERPDDLGRAKAALPFDEDIGKAEARFNKAEKRVLYILSDRRCQILLDVSGISRVFGNVWHRESLPVYLKGRLLSVCPLLRSAHSSFR